MPCLPFLPFFTSLSGAREAGWGRGGRLRRNGESESARPFGPVTRAGAAPGNPRPSVEPTPTCEFSPGELRPGPGRPGKIPRGSARATRRRGDVARRSGAAPLPALELWSPAEDAARLASARGLTDVGEEKDFR